MVGYTIVATNEAGRESDAMYPVYLNKLRALKWYLYALVGNPEKMNRLRAIAIMGRAFIRDGDIERRVAGSDTVLKLVQITVIS